MAAPMTIGREMVGLGAPRAIGSGGVPQAHNGRGHRFRTACRIAAAVVAVAGLRLEAADPDGPPAREGKTYVGRVVDGTGRPIAGASVYVIMDLPEGHNARFGPPKTKRLAAVELATDADGTYRFTIAPEQLATPSFLLSVGVHRPGYVDRSDTSSYSTIAGEEKAGTRPWFEEIRLRRGKAIAGRLVNPEGAPVAGAYLYAMGPTPDARPEEGRDEPDGVGEAMSDADGRFRLDVPPSGPVMYVVETREYVRSFRLQKDGERGDLGTITLTRGNTLRGKVLDTQGKPVAGVYVQAARRPPAGVEPIVMMPIVEEGTGLEKPERWSGLTLQEEFRLASEQVSRTVVTGADGGFTIGTLPAGSYGVAPVEDNMDSPSGGEEPLPSRPLPGLFPTLTLTLKDGEPPKPVVIREAPHVVVEAWIHDSKGNPAEGAWFQINGKIGGEDWTAVGRSHGEKLTTLFVPHGLDEVWFFGSGGGPTVQRHRLSKDAPLSDNLTVPLGRLDHDVKGIEIVSYASPVVVVKVTTSDGARPTDLALWADYTAEKGDWSHGRLALGRNVSSVCDFARQEDGRIRTVGVYPDKELTITARAKGYAAKTSPAFTLAEGATREIELVLEKAP